MTFQDSATTVIPIPPSESGIFVDSVGRAPFETPYDFNCQFTSGVSADMLSYTGFQWAQPIYPHTAYSSEFMFDLFKPVNVITNPNVGSWYPGVQTGNYLSSHYVIYHLPYTFFAHFDGNEESGNPFQTPQKGSYCADMETAFSGDIRITDNNLVPVNLSAIFPGLSISFRYSASTGFRMSAFYVPNETGELSALGYRIFDCRSVRIAHRVHGFGVECKWNPLDVNRGSITNSSQISGNYDNQGVNTVWLPAWLANIANNINVGQNQPLVPLDLSNPFLGRTYLSYSDSTPTLLPLEYIQIFSKELTFQRKMPSYRNMKAVTSQGADVMAIFPILLENAFQLTKLSAIGDSNTWTMRDGYTPQSANFTVTDENGIVLTVSNCLSNFFTANLSGLDVNPLVYQAPFGDATINYRSPGTMNFLIFNVASISATGNYPNPTNQWGDPAAVSLEMEVVHFLKAILV